jgi:hypothetical protein
VQCNDHAGKCSWLRLDVLPETRVLFFPLIAVRRCAFQRDVLTSTDMEQPQITRSTTSNFHLAPCQSDFQPPVPHRYLVSFAIVRRPLSVPLSHYSLPYHPAHFYASRRSRYNGVCSILLQEGSTFRWGFQRPRLGSD